MKKYEIRALYDDETITVYQAYSSAIATEAVKTQRLSASDTFKIQRMTWIKPSWCWMMYRSGYTYKDDRQERVLALRMRHENFLELLRQSCLAHASDQTTKGEKGRIQWDPERGPRLERLIVRSIQIGIPTSLTQTWIEHWIESIEDATDKARQMKKALDEDSDLTKQCLEEMDLMPVERTFEVPVDIKELLGMD